MNPAKTYSEKVGKQVFLNNRPIEGSQQTDEELWDAFKKGSLTAFRVIYEQNIDSLLNYGNRVAPGSTIAADCLQDLFVELWNKKSKLGDVKKIKGYLFTCYRRKLLDFLKKRKKRLDIEYSSCFEILVREPINNWGLGEDTKVSIASALNELPFQQKEAIYLRFFNNLSCSEIGEIMGIMTQSVYNLISSGLKSLRMAAQIKPICY